MVSMTYILKQTRGNKTYHYETRSVWDKDKKRSRQIRRYLGVEGADGKLSTPNKDIKISSIVDYGATYLLDEISKECGLADTLKNVFPDEWENILNISFFKIIRAQPYYIFKSWSEGTYLPRGSALASGDLSRFVSKLGEKEEEQGRFFTKWVERHKEASALVFDITSISSHSRYNEWLEWGYNRDGESLPQINLGAIMAQDLGLPLAYRFCPGSIPDVSTLKNTIVFAKDIGLKKVGFVLDRGFYSASNISDLVKEKLDFTMPLPFSTKEAKRIIGETNASLELAENAFHDKDILMYYQKSKVTINDHDIDAHLFLNSNKQKDELSRFLFKLEGIEKVIEAKQFKDNKQLLTFMEENFNNYIKFFELHNATLKRNNSTISDYYSHMGKFIILTSKKNSEKKELLQAYKNKDVVEKYFDQMKNELDENRLRVSSKNSFSGRLFITFIALIIRSYLTTKFNKTKLVDTMSISEAISNLSLIRKSSTSNGSYLSEISKTNRKIFDALNIHLPT